MSRSPHPNLDFEVDILFREFARLFVEAARSWIPFRHLSPDCYRVPFDAVLRRYVLWTEHSDACQYDDFGDFWEGLLETHGFESDRQWQARQKDYFPTARELVISRYVPQIPAPNGKESWRGKPLTEFMHDPEFWAITPCVDMKAAAETEEHRRKHPEQYGEIRRSKSSRSPAESLSVTPRLKRKDYLDYDEDWLPTEADWKRMEEEDKKGMYPRLQAAPAEAKAEMSKPSGQVPTTPSSEEESDATKETKQKPAARDYSDQWEEATPEQIRKKYRSPIATPKPSSQIPKTLPESNETQNQPEASPQKFATSDGEQAVMQPEKEVLARRQAKTQTAASDPQLLRIRRLAELLHGQDSRRLQMYRWRELPEWKREERAKPLQKRAATREATKANQVERIRLRLVILAVAFAALFAVFILFVRLVWPTPYWYHTAPGTPGNLIRISRFSGRIWVIRNGRWFNGYERDEIAAQNAEEIFRRCWDAPYATDGRTNRTVEFNGYSFSCP